ncbi:MAG: molybdopterin molybdotransferase MoeA [Silicimonas sp.]
MAIGDTCTAGRNASVLTVDAARLRAVAAVARVPGTECLALEDALGRVLANAPPARTSLPPFDNSAMDGFAVRLGHFDGKGPFRFRVSERIIAGDTRPLRLAEGTAARIFTGAPIPEGADAVIMQESVTRRGSVIKVATQPRAGLNIRREGEDRRIGEPVLPCGLRLTPPRLALLAAAGLADVLVHSRLRVGLFSTGNELRDPGQTLEYGQIYNSNRVMLRSLMADPWIAMTDYGILRDDADVIRSAIRQASASNDIVISSGGVSAGEEDHVLDALKREDATLEILKVAIRPGKPLTIGRVGGALFIGLPGNPYAAAITFLQIARPALRKAAGLLEEIDNWIPAVSGFDYPRKVGRREYLPVTWHERDALGRPVLQRLDQGSSASLGPIATAKGIAVIEPDVGRILPGSSLQVEPLLCC